MVKKKQAKVPLEKKLPKCKKPKKIKNAKTPKTPKTPNPKARKKPKKVLQINTDSSDPVTEYSLLRYSAFRTDELAALKRQNLVAADARLAYEMVISDRPERNAASKTGGFFFTDTGRQHGVAVLFTNPRHEITISADGIVGLGEQVLGMTKLIHDDYATNGIFDVPSVRLGVSKMQNVFAKDDKHCIFEYLSPNCAPSIEDGEKSSKAEQKLLKKERVEAGLSVWNKGRVKVCETIDDAVEPEEQLAAHLEDDLSADNVSSAITVVSPLSKLNVSMSSPGCSVTSIKMVNEELTLINSPAAGCLHLDTAPTEHAEPGKNHVKYPFVHYTREAWCETEAGDASNYGTINKKDWTMMTGKTLVVKTLKQIREEDKAHLGRMRRQHAWDMDMAT
jgi:hypothetical protein